MRHDDDKKKKKKRQNKNDAAVSFMPCLSALHGMPSACCSPAVCMLPALPFACHALPYKHLPFFFLSMCASVCLPYPCLVALIWNSEHAFGGPLPALYTLLPLFTTAFPPLPGEASPGLGRRKEEDGGS